MKAGTFLLIHIVSVIVLTSAFTVTAVYPSALLLQAPFMVFTVYSLVFLPTSSCQFGLTRYPQTCRWLVAFIFALAATSILLLYAFNFLSNHYWSTNVNARFIYDYAWQAYSLRETLPLPLWVVVSALTLLFFAVLLFYVRNSNILLRSFAVFWGTSLNSANVSKVEKLVCLMPVVFVVLTVVVFVNRPAETTAFQGAWFGEPVISLFAATTSIDLKHNAADSAAQDASAVRRNITYRKHDNSKSPNVILLVVDALRADHVGAYGYERNTTPFIDSLIADGKAIKVDNGFSTCSESICSIVSMLSARYRGEFSHANTNLNAVLKANGYDVLFLLSADHSWSGLNTYYPPYDYYFDGKSESVGKKYDLTDDRAVIDELGRVKDHKRPTFMYLHLMSAHLSSARKGEFIKYRPYEQADNWYYKLPFVNAGDTSTRQLKINRYDNGIVEADYRVKEIFSILSEKGYLDDAIVWIVSDHGEAFGEHGHFGHGKSLYQPELSIPMVVVDSDLAFYKNTEFAAQVDIAPTIVDRLGIAIPEEWNGRSLGDLSRDERITWHEIPSRKSTEAALLSRSGGPIYKAIFNRKSDPDVDKVFDLRADQDERNNLLGTEQGRAVISSLSKYL